ncbi:MAG: aminodeoxychorismate synthase component I [Deltaproteobacteria bacterium]|nr:aminodeoxychorismate synthase component I [Deltaproteobacteria bacterium]
MSNSSQIFLVSRNQTRIFHNPFEIVSVGTVEDVLPALDRIELAVSRGSYVAGFISYEAAPAFDEALKAHSPGSLPLLWFGLFESMETTENPPLPHEAFSVGRWNALVSRDDYLAAVQRIQRFIAAGDTYQVNYTFPMRSSFSGNPLNWFRQLCDSQEADHCAFVDTGRFQILSASPELFFRLDGDLLEARPMKGTRPRGRWHGEDQHIAAELAAAGKDRAENVMIVDLLRNDMGRCSETGSVEVRSLFDVERYGTVWQMTSAIISRTRAPLRTIFEEMFPSGSVTGAPKVRAMEIIRELEPHPRGVYCGSIGWLGPDRRAEFNVAIRTVCIDSSQGVAEYNVGGGITSGSSPDDEYRECCTKASLLTHFRPEFELLETFLFDGQYYLLSEHLRRLAASAGYFGFALDLHQIRLALDEKAARFHSDIVDLKNEPLKIRLLLARDGSFRLEFEPMRELARVKLGFAREPVNSNEAFLYHKTTYRDVYQKAKRLRPDCDDVLLWNERGEITETTIANIVLQINGEWLTPAVDSGLLAGTMREHLLRSGQIRESRLYKSDVARAASIRLINSVRKWMDVDFVTETSSSLP